MSNPPKTIHVFPGPAERFARSAEAETQRCLDSRDENNIPHYMPRATALLFGGTNGNVLEIRGIEFVESVRATEETVIEEFEREIVPRFGEAYRNPGRGFWCDDVGVFRAVKRQSAENNELIGSVHSHPNWHEIGPAPERVLPLSENPTGMDEYFFARSAWPVNMIWYVRAFEGRMTHRVAAWQPVETGLVKLDLRLPVTLFNDFAIESPTRPVSFPLEQLRGTEAFQEA